MNYRIYITDNIDVVELDCEDLDIKSVYSLLDITNIGNRKDNIRTLTFKGSKTNNNAFGYFFDLSRTTDTTVSNNLLFNYNPLKTVTCLVYENSMLLFKGTLRLTEFVVNANGGITYNTIVTGSFIDLKTAIQDKYLSDLDFSDLAHNYNIGNIVNSWTANTSYVYPNIDYGYYSTGTTTVNDIDCRNFKPALKATEYLDRIFQQSTLSGYTYEIKGDDDFKTMFNNLIVPDTQEGAKYYTTGVTSSYSITSGTTAIQYDYNGVKYQLVPVNNITPTSTIASLYSTYDNVLTVDKNVNIGIGLDITISGSNTSTILPATFKAQIVKRLPQTNNNPVAFAGAGWNVLCESSFSVPTGSTLVKNIKLNISDVTFKKDEQLGVIVTGSGERNFTGSSKFNFRVTSSNLQLPIGRVIYDVTPSMYSGDTIAPVAPANIKQMDFLKAIVNTFNFVVYTTNENHKHLLFERYDDFYSLCTPVNLLTNALDWSSKVDYNKGLKGKSNIELPKSYLFSYKTDVDYLNVKYKERFNSIYGELTFDDSYGLQETKKVELIFSPTILSTPTGTDRKYPLLYKVDNDKIKPTKTNIRLAYYNGLQPCLDYTIYNDIVSGGTATYYTGNTYPQISNYYLQSGTSINDIHFASPVEYYFNASDDYTSSSTAYQDYYINQVTELTNPNVIYVECDVLLNEIDIANLDLKVPVYINTGDYNGSYFKVLKVEYENANTPSKVQLQKIVF